VCEIKQCTRDQLKNLSEEPNEPALGQHFPPGYAAQSIEGRTTIEEKKSRSLRRKFSSGSKRIKREQGRRKRKRTNHKPGNISEELQEETQSIGPEEALLAVVY
jgi:hypothetical protein